MTPRKFRCTAPGGVYNCGHEQALKNVACRALPSSAPAKVETLGKKITQTSRKKELENSETALSSLHFYGCSQDWAV
jgi:hypothetical protein